MRDIKLRAFHSMKKKLGLNRHIKIVEFDPNKQYALIFPEWIGPQEFENIANILRNIGVSKFVAIHASSDPKLEELREMKTEDLKAISFHSGIPVDVLQGYLTAKPFDIKDIEVPESTGGD